MFNIATAGAIKSVSGSTAFSNAGTIDISGFSGTAIIGAPFTNSIDHPGQAGGVLDVDTTGSGGSNLTFTNSVTNSGVIHIGNGTLASDVMVSASNGIANAPGHASGFVGLPAGQIVLNGGSSGRALLSIGGPAASELPWQATIPGTPP